MKNLKKKGVLIVIAILFINIGKAQYNKITYADPSSQTISLFAVKANTIEEGKIIPVGYAIFTKDGSITWKVNILKAGTYHIRISYAYDKEGAKVSIIANESTLPITLPATSGYFDTSENVRKIPRGQLFHDGFPDWLQMNYERRDIGLTTQLAAGENTITASINIPVNETSFYLHSLELLSTRVDAKAELQIAAKQRANSNWLMHSGYGLMFHWTSQTMPRSGPQMKYTDAVNAFNVIAFADMVKKTGATYVIFTANHQDPHFPGPLKEWEALHPGWTTNRDLISEISDALNARQIKLILYLNTPGMAHYSTAPGMGNNPPPEETEYVNNVIKLITEVGNHYGKRIAGYWLDSFNFIDPQYPDFPFERFYKACKAGNPNRLIALNTWIMPIDTKWQDYYAGELVTIGNPPSSLRQSYGPGRGLPFHALLALYGEWVHVWPNTPIKPPVFTVDELSAFINATKDRGAVTLNAGIYQDGTIGEEQTRYFNQLCERVYGQRSLKHN